MNIADQPKALRQHHPEPATGIHRALSGTCDEGSPRKLADHCARGEQCYVRGFSPTLLVHPF